VCNLILSDSRCGCNPPSDLICPRCFAACTFSSTVRRVACLHCGWAVVLTDIQHTEIIEALTGVTTLPLPAYLQVLALTAPAPPSGGAFGGHRTPLALGA